MQQQKELTLLIGSYAEKETEGIYVCRFNAETGEIRLVSAISGIENPSYLAVSSDGKRVHSVSETDEQTSAVYAYTLDARKGILTFLNACPTDAAAPCYIWVDRDSELVATANYNGGSLTFLGLEKDGSLTSVSSLCVFSGFGKDSMRQLQPHLHSVYASPDEQFLFANDLGTDRIYKYELRKDKESGKTVAVQGKPAYFETEPGSGPRHSCFHPNGRFMYTIGELSGNVTAFAYGEGNLRPIQTIEADSLHAAGSADIHISPDGAFLYASNRLKGDGIAIFSVDESTGLLTKAGYQEVKRHPRNFLLTPDGAFLLCAGRDENVIQVFRRDSQSGLLENSGKEFSVKSPVCLKFVSLEGFSK